MSPKPSSRASSSASTSRGFDKELAESEALSEAMKSGAKPDAAQVEQLRKALAHRNNFLVSKAAKLVADAELFALLPRPIRNAGRKKRWPRRWSSWSIAQRIPTCAA
jgi:hypothetical protein